MFVVKNKKMNTGMANETASAVIADSCFSILPILSKFSILD